MDRRNALGDVPAATSGDGLPAGREIVELREQGFERLDLPDRRGTPVETLTLDVADSILDVELQTLQCQAQGHSD